MIDVAYHLPSHLNELMLIRRYASVIFECCLTLIMRVWPIYSSLSSLVLLQYDSFHTTPKVYTTTKTFSPMIGSPAPPYSRDDLAGLLYAPASFWPPPWLNLILAVIIIGGLALYCKHHIVIYVSIDNMWHVMWIKGYHTAIHIAIILISMNIFLSSLLLPTISSPS